MQQWEYSVKTLSESTIEAQPEFGPVEEEGNGLLNSDYGAAGWELVSIVPAEHPGLFHLFFKRPSNRKRPDVEPTRGNFTIKDYIIYRAVLHMPMSLDETLCIELVARALGTTQKAVNTSIRKVQMDLIANNWMSTPESEVQHALDWTTDLPHHH